MTEEQKTMRGFNRWYRVTMDFAVFGPDTEDQPIVVED
jgi:hypothetical protein